MVRNVGFHKASAIFGVALLALCTASSQASPYLEGSPLHYTNPHYGLNVLIPDGLTVCVDDDGIRMSRGFLIPLTGENSCASRNPFNRPLVTFHVAGGPAERCEKSLVRISESELTVPGHKTIACHGPFVNTNFGADPAVGKDLVQTVLLARSKDKEPVNLNIVLITTQDREKRHMEVLKTILQGVKLGERRSD